MIPELPIAMLACARIGAPHTVVFGGFSRRGAVATASTTRRRSSSSPPTAAGGAARRRPSSPRSTRRWRRRPTIEHVLVVRRVGDALEGGTAMAEGRDVWWHDIVDRQSDDCPPVPVDSEHMLYLLYTSGTTAKPKGILHTTAGYLLGARSPTRWSSTSSPTTCTGAPPTSAG